MESFKKEYLSKYNIDLEYFREICINTWSSEFSSFLFKIIDVIEVKYNNINNLLNSIYRKRRKVIFLTNTTRNNYITYSAEETLEDSIDILYNNEGILKDMIKEGLKEAQIRGFLPR